LYIGKTPVPYEHSTLIHSDPEKQIAKKLSVEPLTDYYLTIANENLSSFTVLVELYGANSDVVEL
jgi:hypothetical protein